MVPSAPTPRQLKPTRPPPVFPAHPSVTEEQLERLFRSIAGGQGFVKACEEPGMPSSDVVMRLLNEDPIVRGRYARARAIQADTRVAEIIEIADRERLDPKHKAIMVDVRKWIASKFDHGNYGDRITVEDRPAPMTGEQVRAQLGDKLDALRDLLGK